MTTPDESLFVYQQGKSHATYHNPSYQPIFADSQKLDFQDKALEKEAQDICGDSSQCMFDIFTTGKVRIGRATKETVRQFVAVINDTDKPGKQYNNFLGQLALGLPRCFVISLVLLFPSENTIQKSFKLQDMNMSCSTLPTLTLPLF